MAHEVENIYFCQNKKGNKYNTHLKQHRVPLLGLMASFENIPKLSFKGPSKLIELQETFKRNKVAHGITHLIHNRKTKEIQQQHTTRT